MNKVVAIIAVVIVIAGGIWFFMQNKNQDGQTKTDTSSAQTQEPANEESSSLKNLMGMNKSQKCEFSSTEEDVTSSGTFYIANNKARGDFQSTAKGTTTKGHMIIDSIYSWLWNDGSNEGIKFAIDQNQTESNQTQSVDPNKNYKFSCDSWRADDSMFTPPANITFSEFKMPAIPAQPSGTSEKMDLSAICNSLPEPSKSECLAGAKNQ